MTRGRGFVRAGTLVMALLASSCTIGRHSPPLNAFRVTNLDGTARIRDSDATRWRTALEGMTVASGATVSVSSGSVTLGRGESTVEIRPSENTATASVMVGSLERIEVAAGDVLASIDPAARIGVESQGIGARTNDGVFRFDRRFSVRVGVYQGRATVDSSEGELVVPSLREGVVSGRVLPRAVVPYVIHADDPWDRRLLGDVISLDDSLRAQASGYEAQFGAHLKDVGVLSPIAQESGVALSFARPYLGRMRSGDVLAGIVLAVQVQKKHGDVASVVFPRLVSLMDQGATWGLMARDRGVALGAYRVGVERAVALLTGSVRPSPSASPQPSPTPSTSPTPTRTPTQSPGPTPPPGRLEAPTGLTAKNGDCAVLTSTDVNLSWNASRSDGVSGYEIFRSESAGGPYGSVGKVRGAKTTAFVDTSVEFSKTYHYVVRATAGSKSSAASNETSVTTPNNVCV